MRDEIIKAVANQYTVFDCCDVCDSLLTEEEDELNPRWGRNLCSHCATEADEANPQRKDK